MLALLFVRPEMKAEGFSLLIILNETVGRPSRIVAGYTSLPLGTGFAMGGVQMEFYMI